MGMAKQQMIEEQERGFSYLGDESVCYDCFYDDGIKKFIKSNATANCCDFCNKKSSKNNIAMSIDEVTEFIMDSLLSEYDDPGNELPYESREGGYQGETQDLWDLLLYDCLIVENGDSPVFQKIHDAIWGHHPSWCKKDYFGMTDSEIGQYSWEKFKKLVLHKARYMFFKIEPEKSEYDDHWEEVTPPLQILSLLARHVIEIGLVETMPRGKELYRARLDSEKKFTEFDDMGTPFIKHAKYPNRMSPAGIPMFYVTHDIETAIAETWDGKEDSVASIGKFKTLEEYLIIDLSNIPPIPSLFDEERRHLRETIKFLEAFMIDFSRPINKDGKEHIDYVPTQIVTEYFRHV